ncbi:putative MFS family arabinose efflux permease [Breoghania corrubedonensis]|uniref:Putative MFS family arabinose efflux permease n=1 Tax=Breoghania corrubedonensis TaxID=665038 RepID=A0A2T5VCH4_9HYPH|nr:MFS transporter [Breoghania corrubedonensis]PTW61469.1 putative MFS family arabinose efflux permease [Breoghania corrubedonensis]
MPEALPPHLPLLSTSARWRGLAAAISTITAVGIALGLGLPLLSLLLEQRGISPAWTGINTAFAGIASVAVTPFVTPLAKRVGTARLAFWMVIVSALCFYLFYVIEAFWAWFPLRIVFHGAVTATFVLSEFWINALAPAGRRGLVMGIYATILSLGFVAGPVMFAAIGSLGALPFAIGTAILFLAALPVLLARDTSPPLDGGHDRPFIRFFLIAPMATLAGFVFGSVESGAMSLLPIYGVHIGLEPGNAALLVSAFVGGNVLMQVPLGLLADRFERRQLLALCALVGLFGALAIPFMGNSLPALSILLVAWGGIIAGLYTIGLTHLGARFTGANLASANAAFAMMYSLGMLAGPLAMGAALDTGYPPAMPWTIAGFFVLYLVVAYRRMYKPEGV